MNYTIIDISVGEVYSITLTGRRFRVLAFGRRYRRRRQQVTCQYIDNGTKFNIALEDLFSWLDEGELYYYRSYWNE